VTPSDDFQDEMRWIGNWSDQDMEALFQGDSSRGDDALIEHLRETKNALLEEPPHDVAAVHLSAMVAEARVLVFGPKPISTRSPATSRYRATPWRAAMRGLRRAAVAVAVVTIGGMGSMAGLAYAGVSLPSPALTAFQKIGIHLPNQPQNHGSPSSLPTASQHGQSVKAIATAGPGGCAFGQEVAGVASSKRQDAKADAHRQDAGHRPENPCDRGVASPAPAPSTTGPGGHGQSPGYGKDNHPSGKPTSQPTNPTGKGQSANPTGRGHGGQAGSH
jgi:hypothetical protein